MDSKDQTTRAERRNVLEENRNVLRLRAEQPLHSLRVNLLALSDEFKDGAIASIYIYEKTDQIRRALDRLDYLATMSDDLVEQAYQ